MVIGALNRVIAAVEDEAERLIAEFHRPEGPRGRRGHCEVDKEIEERLRARLQAIIPCEFAGEETGMSSGTQPGWTWLVDPHDGTFEFMAGRPGPRGSVGRLRGNPPGPRAGGGPVSAPPRRPTPPPGARAPPLP